MENHKDEELMLAYKSGDSSALQEIFERYKKRLLNYGLRLLNNLADAEDMVSETFYILTARRDSYEATAKFSSWIYAIARNLCMDKFRARKKTQSLWRPAQDGGFELMDLEDTAPRADETAAARDVQAFVKKAIGRLPLKYREALILREYESLGYEEIAKVMACSIENVKVLIFRARERLRREILPFVKEAV